MRQSLVSPRIHLSLCVLPVSITSFIIREILGGNHEDELTGAALLNHGGAAVLWFRTPLGGVWGGVLRWQRGEGTVYVVRQGLGV